jgi:hypothetical protein
MMANRRHLGFQMRDRQREVPLDEVIRNGEEPISPPESSDDVDIRANIPESRKKFDAKMKPVYDEVLAALRAGATLEEYAAKKPMALKTAQALHKRALLFEAREAKKKRRAPNGNGEQAQQR